MTELKSVVLTQDGYTQDGKWRLVPVEPNGKMSDAASQSHIDWFYACEKAGDCLPYTSADSSRAMIKASPSPELPDALQVWFGSMPESNGNTNWTAILHRGDISKGITIERSEYKDRIRYEADRMRYLIGEIADKPDILAYDPDLIEPQTEINARGERL